MLQKLNMNFRKVIVTLKVGLGVGRKTLTFHKLLKITIAESMKHFQLLQDSP